MTDLRGLAAAAGFVLEAEQAAVLERYLDLVERDRERYDLTSIRDRDDLVRRQIVESLALLRVIEEHLGQRDAIDLADIGSGSGVPGLVLSVMRPAWRVTLVEASTAKAGWLERASGELGVEVSVVSLRAEAAARTEDCRESFDVVTAKAVAALPVLLELAIPLLRPGGLLFAPKGSHLAPELASAAGALALLNAEALAVPPLPQASEPGQRVAVIRRAGPLDDRFPRGTAAIIKRPL